MTEPVLGAAQLAAVAKATIGYGGQWHGGLGPAIAVVNPANGELVAEVPSATAEQAEAALSAARQAQHAWARTGPSARAQLLRDIAGVLRENTAELAYLLRIESGKTQVMCEAEVTVSAMFLELNAEWALRLEGEILPSDSPDEQIQIVREPIGVVVAICAWNWPLAVWARKAAQALVVGNTLVTKPSEVTPLATVRAIQLIEEHTDVPVGVLGIVTGGGDIGAALVKSPTSDMVTMTGHRDTGKKIMADAAGTLTRVALELGGKAPAIVLKDADLDVAIPALVGARFATAGQQCGAAERILVEREIADEFVRRFAEAVSTLRTGDPVLNLDYGPLVNAKQREKVEAAVAAAVDQGASVATGGGRPEGAEYDGGFYYLPTVLTNVTPEMSIAVEETFGPVIPVTVVDSFDDAIEVANGTRYGLAAYLFTQSYASAMRGAREIECGELFINRSVGEAMHAHHGGHKESGLGGEDGKHGMLKFTQLKVVYHNW